MNIDDDVDDAIEYIGGLDSAEPRMASKQHSVEFYEAVAERCQDMADALKDDIKRENKTP